MVEKIKIIFLGTGSAIPTPKKNHPAVLLKYKQENILLDCGEGTQRQFRIARLNPCKITRILITHWHADHVLGLPGLLQTLMLNGYNKTLKIYGPKNTKKRMGLYINLFAHKGKKFPIKIYETKPGRIINEKEFYIEAESMKHDIPTNAYSFIIKGKLRLNKQKLKKLKIPKGKIRAKILKSKTIKITGRKINTKNLIYKEKAKKITFIMDTGENKKAVKIAKNSDLLISESTYSAKEKKIAKDYKHLTAEQAANIAKKSKSKELILMHLSQRYEKKQEQEKILNQAKKIFKNTSIAKDFTKTEV
jgi:ribonuclease Z